MQKESTNQKEINKYWIFLCKTIGKDNQRHS